jgi:hypothetical protein
VNDILVHVGTVLENMKKGTSYNNKTYFEFKLPIAIMLLKNTFNSYLFVDGEKFPHTNHDKLGYHPIHCTHYTDYQT